jgi:hypothetical protein
VRRVNTRMGWADLDNDRFDHALVSDVKDMDWIFDGCFCNED